MKTFRGTITTLVSFVQSQNETTIALLVQKNTKTSLSTRKLFEMQIYAAPIRGWIRFLNRCWPPSLPRGFAMHRDCVGLTYRIKVTLYIALIM